MKLTTSLKPAAAKIRVWADKSIGEDALAQVLAQAAKQALREAQEKGEAGEEYEKYVDGVEGAAEETVKANGRIVYKFQWMAEILDFTHQFLKLRSPLNSRTPHGGQASYKDSFMFAEVGKRSFLAKNMNPKFIKNVPFYVYNRQPYGRRVDVQYVGKKRIRFEVPPGIMDDAAAAIKRRYGKLVTVRSLYNLKVPSMWIIGQGKWIMGKGTKAGTQVHVPALLIEPKDLT